MAHVIITAIRCKRVRPLVNGTVLGNDVLYGASVRYRCNIGFRLQGPETRTCQADGTWSDNEPTCSGEFILHGSKLNCSQLITTKGIFFRW